MCTRGRDVNVFSKLHVCTCTYNFSTVTGAYIHVHVCFTARTPEARQLNGNDWVSYRVLHTIYVHVVVGPKKSLVRVPYLELFLTHINKISRNTSNPNPLLVPSKSSSYLYEPRSSSTSWVEGKKYSTSLLDTSVSPPTVSFYVEGGGWGTGGSSEIYILNTWQTGPIHIR